MKRPYGKLDGTSGATVIAYISLEDKAVLRSFADHGAIQLVVQNLLKNLIDDVRTISNVGYNPNADEILTILTERRDPDGGQLQRLGAFVGRGSALGLVRGGPQSLGRPREGEGKGQPDASAPTEPTDLQGGTERGKRRVGTKASGKEKGSPNPGAKASKRVGKTDV